MRRLTYLFSLPVLMWIHSLTAAPLPCDPFIIQQEPAEGVELYVKPHTATDEWLSLKVVFKYAPGEHALFSLDLANEDWDQVQDFLTACAESAESGDYSHLNALYPTSFASLLHATSPTHIGIIAVGQDVSKELAILIEALFATRKIPVKTESYQVSFSDELEPSELVVNLTFDSTSAPIQTQEDLEERWQNLMLEELLSRRLEECTRKLGERWIHPHPQGFFPVGGFALLTENDAENVLGFFLWQLDRLLQQQSFNHKKEEILRHLSYLIAEYEALSCAQMAACYADLFLLQACHLQLEPLLEASLTAVQEMGLDDLAQIEPQAERTHLVYAKQSKIPLLEASAIENIKQNLADLATDMRETVPESEFELDLAPCANPLGSSYFALAQNISSSSFYQLPLSGKDQEYIDSIITTMADNNIFQLAFHKSSLEKKGKKIDGVHPLRFMGYILSNRKLKECVKTIKKSSFKWDALIDGFSRKMRDQMRHNNVYPHLDGFAATVGTSIDRIRPYVENGDFEGLVKSLL